MNRFHAAHAVGKELTFDERKELEALVDAEWQGAIDRAAELLQNTKQAQEQTSKPERPPS